MAGHFLGGQMCLAAADAGGHICRADTAAVIGQGGHRREGLPLRFHRVIRQEAHIAAEAVGVA